MAGWLAGTFTRFHNWVADRDASIDITATRFDEENDTFATGINNCLTKDGQNSPTANLPMATRKHTNVANSSARTEYAATGQVQDNSFNYAVDTGSADAYAITPSPTITAYVAGQKFTFKAVNANTDTSTLAVSGLTATTIYKYNDQILEAGDIEVDGLYEVEYDGTNFQLVSMPSVSMVRTTGDTMTGNLDVTGNVTITGDLDVTGASSISLPATNDFRLVLSGTDLTLERVTGSIINIDGTARELTGTLPTLDPTLRTFSGGTTSDGPFELNETITQTTSNATFKFIVEISNVLYVEDLTGTPDGTNLLTGGTSSATYTPTSTGAAFTADTNYYIYAYYNVSAVSLEGSTTSYTVDATTGRAQKTGDSTRRLVGLARAVTGIAWQDDEDASFVLSYNHRKRKNCNGRFTVDRTVSSSSYAEVNSEIRNEFLTWSDEIITCGMSGTASNATAANASNISLGIDGTTAEDCNQHFLAQNVRFPIGMTLYKSGLSEGYHYVTVLGKETIGGNAITLYGGGAGTQSTSLHTAIMG